MFRVIPVLKAIAANPVAFLRTFYPGGEAWQETVMRLLWKYPRVGVVSCNGAGKTWIVGRVVVAWVLAHPGSIVVTTAGTWAQVRNQVWKEIHAAHAKLPDWLTMGKPCKITSWHLTPGWYAIGLSTNDVYHFEGFHSPRTLVVVDEAKSATQGLFDAISRIFSGRGSPALLVVSSTGDASGPHYEIFNEQRVASKYVRLKVNPFEAWYMLPGQTTKHPVEPTHALTAEFIDDMKTMYGEDSPMYRSIVLAEWTEDVSAWCLFPPGVLKDCYEPGEVPTGSPIEYWIGGDVAHSLDGDESALYVVRSWIEVGRQHYQPVDMLTFRTNDAEVYSDNVMSLAGKWSVPAHQVNIEGDGIGGPTCDILDRREFRVNRVIVGSSATVDTPRLANVRAQMWWNGHEIARSGRLHGLTDEMTRSQLSEVHYGHDAQGRILAESKDKVAHRISRSRPRCPWHSPDRGDALLLSLLRLDGPPSPGLWEMGDLYGDGLDTT